MNPDYYERVIFNLMHGGQTYFNMPSFAADGSDWHYEHKTQNDNGVRMGTAEELEPRFGYYDAGIILAETFTVSRAQYEEMSAEEWNAISDFLDEMENLEVRQLDVNAEYEIFHVFDKVPVITSMEA